MKTGARLSISRGDPGYSAGFNCRQATDRYLVAMTNSTKSAFVTRVRIDLERVDPRPVHGCFVGVEDQRTYGELSTTQPNRLGRSSRLLPCEMHLQFGLWVLDQLAADLA